MVRGTAERRKRKRRPALPVFLERTAAIQVSAQILSRNKSSGPRTESADKLWCFHGGRDRIALVRSKP